MKIRLFSFFAVLSLLIVVLVKVGLANGGPKLTFEHLSIPDGLSNNAVFSMHQDRFGYLWIGTQDGLNRYDGYEFKIYKNNPGDSTTISNNSVYSISGDEDGRLLLGTMGGLSFFERNTSIFSNFAIDSTSGAFENNQNLVISTLLDSRDNLWLGTAIRGILRFDKKTKTFEHMKIRQDTTESIISSVVAAIFETADNELIIASIQYGILKYNPDDNIFEPFFENPENNQPFINNLVRVIYEDSRGRLYFGSQKSMHVLNRPKEQLSHIEFFKPDGKFGANSNFISSIVSDKKGSLWIGTTESGLFRFNLENQTHTHFTKDETGSGGLSSNRIWTVFIDQSEILWIGTLEEGLNKIDFEKEPFEIFRSIPGQNSLSGNNITAIQESAAEAGVFWIGTDGAGLNRYDRENKSFKAFPQLAAVSANRGLPRIRAIYEDPSAVLWLGTWESGLIRFNPKNNTIKNYRAGTSPNNLSSNNIRVIKADEHGHLWIGTSFGLNQFDTITESISRIHSLHTRNYTTEMSQKINEIRKSKTKAAILAVKDDQDLSEKFTVDTDGDFLLISVGEGLPQFNMVDFGWLENANGQTIWEMGDYTNSYLLPGGSDKNRVRCTVINLKPGKYRLRYKSDDSHSFGKWNAPAPADSAWWGIQLLSLGKSEKAFFTEQLEKAGNQLVISGVDVRDIHISEGNSVWVALRGGGLSKLDPVKRKVEQFPKNPGEFSSLSHNSIEDIFEAKNGVLWLTTFGGLLRLDPLTGIIKNYSSGDGLPTDYLSSILQDNNGVLWISSVNGLTKFDPAEKTERPIFISYDIQDGLQGYHYNPRSSFKSKKGELLLGGRNGLNVFLPGRINKHAPQVSINEFRINNIAVTPAVDGSPLDKHISMTREISLPFSQNNFSFEFSAIHFSRPEKNKLLYMLAGFDETWIDGKRRFASYTNLDPGDYVFKLKGANSDGVWNEQETSIAITILSPWYRTWWAYLLFTIFIIGIFYFWRRIELGRREQKAKIRESELRAQTAEAQAKVIQAENERKSKELEEARQLQLSMLPKKLPELSHLDIAVYMQTATEVGGDYYDFHVGLDGTLTVVVGDATGHGMKAGTVVTATKSLFSTLAPDPDILSTFKEMTRCLKQLDLHLLSMCMTIMKINQNKLVYSSAGMPPALLYRGESKIVEELLIKGMPLGTFKNFPYQMKDTTLAPGDTILFMSDGMPELFNNQQEMFGYERIADLFRQSADQPPVDIIDTLKNAGSDWVNGDDPQDDVTFVVIKVK